MIKKLTIIRNEHDYWISRGSTSRKTQLITNVLTDFCSDNFIDSWIKDTTSLEIEGNYSVLTKENNFMIFQPLYYKGTPDTFKCSKKAFIRLIDQWNTARKKGGKFIILELDEKNNMSLCASDTVPDEYPFELPPILPLR